MHSQKHFETVWRIVERDLGPLQKAMSTILAENDAHSVTNLPTR